MLAYFWLPSDFATMLTAVLMAQTAALLLDHFLGEPNKYHPLVGFGKLINFFESRLNIHSQNRLKGASSGALAWVCALFPLLVLLCFMLFYLLQLSAVLFWLASILVLYFTIGLNSLKQHAFWVAIPLQNGDLEEGRCKVSWLVSRETENMDEIQVTKACMESVLENGSDAVYGALFWFAIAGAPGALLYRLANTLDASWGYRSARFVHFGWFAARMDDWLNLIPARLCSFFYSLSGDHRNAFASWRKISAWRKGVGEGMSKPDWASPNAGIVMSSGAGALNLSLGGSATYEGIQQVKPELGIGCQPSPQDIGRSVALLYNSLVLAMAFQALALSLIFLVMGSRV